MEQKTPPKFSIIISVQNAGKYIQKCLDSIKEQTNQDYEVIIVNDNCTDLSMHKVKKWEDENPEIKLKVSSLDGKAGLNPAKNKGLEVATGKYIIFIEPEDEFSHSRALENIYQCIEENNNPYAIVLGYESHWKNKKIPKKENYANDKKATKEYQIGKNNNGNVWSLCLKRDLLEDNHIRFMEEAREQTSRAIWRFTSKNKSNFKS